MLKKSIVKIFWIIPKIKILNQKIGSIKEGFLADCIFLEKKSIDLDPLNNPHAAIVHRASENSIKAIMIGGEFVHGKI